MGISLCMVVKDEEKYLDRALSSVKGLVDEMIVVDTGSKDRTKEIAEAHGASVFDFEWCNDFSAARNFSLSKAKSDWILVLDADEFICRQKYGDVRDAVSNAPDDVGGFSMEQRTYLERSIPGAIPNPTRENKCTKEVVGFKYSISFRPVRLFRRGFKYTYNVHEQVEVSIRDAGKEIRDLDVVIHHLGSVKPNEIIKEKVDFYKRLLVSQLEKSPGIARIQFLAGKMYMDDGNLSKARTHLQRAAELDPRYKNPYRELGTVLVRMHLYDKAEEAFRKAMIYFPDDLLTYNNMAVVQMHQKKYAEARELLRDIVKKHPKHSGLLRNLMMVEKLAERGKCRR